VSDGSNKRKWLWLVLRVVVALAALGWTFSKLDFGKLVDSVAEIAPWAFVLAVSMALGALVLGAFRWRVLLHAYGAARPPSLFFLTRVYHVGLFYNTFLPANVAGDVLRGHVTRSAFDGMTGAYLVVAIERVFGLAGLLLLGAVVLMFRPVGETDLRLIGIFGVLAALFAALAPVVGRRLGSRLPGRLGKLAASLPRVERPLLLVLVLLLSMGTQSVVALTGHTLLVSLHPTLALSDSFVLVPLAMISLYLPTVAGLGVREAAFVFFFGKVGVSAEDATAASLAFFAVQLLVAATGGIAHLVAPLKVSSDEPPKAPERADATE
jgi:uncharacterized membrane protein YbhN (UPF0104 family)